jgi:enoyl-CoA hydratase/carnithine racemase
VAATEEHDGELLVDRDGPVLSVTFNRPDQRNAMTWPMYEGLRRACDLAESERDIRVMVLRGAGGKAFVAGTDIAHFQDFTDGQDGVDYEAGITEVVDRLESLPVPTVAAITGYCVGAGLVLAAVCDLRLATASARFGVPVARTLGNCLSMNSYSLLVHHLGPARTLDLLLRARMLEAEEAAAAGFLAEVCADEHALDGVLAETTARLVRHAPLTMWAATEAVRRLRRATLPDGDDIVARVYASEDFHHGVTAFLAKDTPTWTGR